MAKIPIRLALALLAGALPHFAVAQEGKRVTAPLAIRSSGQPEQAGGSVMREIDDPGTGARWLLVADPTHPGGPGRLVAKGGGAPRQQRAAGPAERSDTSAVAIRAGDRVQVEEHSPVVDASFESVALSSAIPGAMLRVRLCVGGRVIAVRALGPGRAESTPTGAKQ